MSTLVGAFKEMVEYVNMLKSTMAEGAEFHDIIDKSATSLMNTCAAAKGLTFAEATECLKMMGDTPFSMEKRSLLQSQINGLVGGRASGGAGGNRAKCQSLMHLHRFMGKHHWEALSNKLMGKQARMAVARDILFALGCRNPSPYTITNLLTIMNLCIQDDIMNFNIDAGDFYDQRTDFMKLWESFKKSWLPITLPHVVNYPSSPEELHTLYPDIYNIFYKVGTPQAFEAIASPIDETVISQVRACMPTRNTHATLALRLKPFKQSRACTMALQHNPAFANIAVGNGSMPFALGNGSMGMATHSCYAPPPPHNPLAIKDCSTHANHSHVRGQLALMDGPPPAQENPAPEPSTDATSDDSPTEKSSSVTFTLEKIKAKLAGCTGDELTEDNNNDGNEHDDEEPPNKKQKNTNARCAMKKRPAAHTVDAASSTIKKRPSSCTLKDMHTALPPSSKPPSENPGVLRVANYKVYTAMSTQTWRAQRVGDKKDAAIKWHPDHVAAWKKVAETIKANKPLG